MTCRYQRALTESRDPVLIPQQAKELVVQRGLEDLYFKRVILIGMHAEIFNLVKRNGLVF